MTVLSLPSSAGIARMHWELQRNDVMDGLLALRASDPLWRVGLEFSSDLEANSGYLKALLMRLRGGVNQLELHDLARPAPVGTMRGVLTLASSVVAGATSMSIVAANDNLLTFPEAFDNAAWSKSGASVTADAAVAPDGLVTMDKLVESAATATHFLSRSASSIETQFSISVFAMQGERRYLRLCIADTSFTSGTRAYVVFDLQSGTATSPGGITATDLAAAITPVGGGIFGCALSATIGDTNGAVLGAFNLASSFSVSSTPPSYAGDGASGLYLWGAKLNTGLAATPYGYGKTLKKGDLLGIGSGTTQQVVMVTEDATSTSQGNITVQFQPPLRNAFSGGQSVVWDKPKALFRRVSNELGWDYRGKNVITSGMTIDLVEDTRA
jgi:hypothetical protein